MAFKCRWIRIRFVASWECGRGFDVRLILHSSVLQVLSFVVFGFLVAGCYAFFVPFIPELGARIALAVIYGIIVCIVLTLAYLTRFVSSSPMHPKSCQLRGGGRVLHRHACK